MSIKNIHDADALLLYRVGPVYCCSPTFAVENVIMPPRMNHPPGLSATEPGVFKVDQGIVKAINLRKRFGVEESNWVSPGRVVIVEVEGGHAGFWVDEIIDVIQRPSKGWGSVPAYLPKDVFSRTLLLEDVIYLYADFENIYKLKEMGYLRQHIEYLQELERKNEPVSGANEANISNKKHDIPISNEVENIKHAEHENICDTNVDEVSATGFAAEQKILNNKLDGDGVKHSVAKTDKPVVSAVPRIIKKPQNFSPVVLNASPPNKRAGVVHEVAAGEVARVVYDGASAKRADDLKKMHTEYDVDKSSPVVLIALVVVVLMFGGYGIYTILSPDESKLPQKIISYKKNIEVVKENKIVTDKKSYHADIKKEKEGLVIVLTQLDESESVDGEYKKSENSNYLVTDIHKQQQKQVISGSAAHVEEKVIEVSVVPGKELATQETIKADEGMNDKVTIHQVVKGDTLWHIARRYIHDPFRYPELARLSHIKNPDLIYPGDRVKIIYKNANK